MSVLFVILLLIYAQLAVSQKETSINWHSEDQFATNGEYVQFQCDVDHKGTLSLKWIKEGAPIAIDNKIIDEEEDKKNPKFQAFVNDRRYTLRINNITDDDAGIYECLLSKASKQFIKKQMKLTVRIPPTILENTTSPVTARVDTETKLECYVRGNPPPKAIWSRENNGLLPNGEERYEGNVLRIDRVRKEDAGTYYCTAQNSVGPGVKKTYKLQVEFEPQIEVARKKVGQALQYKAELECRVRAFPDPQIIWRKDHNHTLSPVMLPQYYNMSTSTQPNAVTIGKLVITTVNRSLYGTYSCIAKNMLGEGQETIEFYETAEAQGGSNSGYGDFKLVLSTACLVLLIFRW